MEWFERLVRLPWPTKLAITGGLFLLGLKFHALVLVFLPWVWVWKPGKKTGTDR